MEFAYDGGGLAKGGDVTLYYDGKSVGEGRVEFTQPMIFSADETTDVGYESGTPVSADYSTGHKPVHRQDQLGPDRSRRRTTTTISSTLTSVSGSSWRGSRRGVARSPGLRRRLLDGGSSPAKV